MASYRYLIVGGGMTGAAACKGIREHDSDGSIGLFAEESHDPYARPPLTKGLWKGKPEDSIWRGTPELGVEIHHETPITSLDLDSRTAADSAGTTHSFERILLATGGTPRRVEAWDDGVLYYRTLDHYHRLRDLASEGARVAVIGAGFIGSEIAAALTMNGCAVTMVFPGDAIGERIFPAELAAFVNGYYREKGVDVLAGETVAGVSRNGGSVSRRDGERSPR